MGQNRVEEANSCTVCGRDGSEERTLGGGLHRGQVHHGEKGALVGQTTRGEGTKLMVMADGAGTPPL
jgi:hypothetical protein